jgi:hypothetical protein
MRKGATRTCFVIIGKELLHVKEKEGFPSAAGELDSPVKDSHKRTRIISSLLENIQSALQLHQPT